MANHLRYCINLVQTSYNSLCKKNDPPMEKFLKKDQFDVIFKHDQVIEYCSKNKKFGNNLDKYNILINAGMDVHLEDICHVQGYTEKIKRAIYYNGPVIALIKLYTDFFVYSKGIYERTSNKYLEGYYSVIIQGWGVENKNGTEMNYWVIKNDWGNSWGEDGLAKISMSELNDKLELKENVYAITSYENDIGESILILSYLTTIH